MMEPTPTRTPRARATITIAEVPMRVRMLPPSLQAAWVLNFNAKLKDGDSEQDAAVAAWAVVELVKKELERQYADVRSAQAEKGGDKEMNIKLAAVKKHLGLPSEASLSEVKSAFSRLVDDLAGEDGDPRVTLSEKARELAEAKGLEFDEGLKLAKDQHPELVEAIALGSGHYVRR